MKDLLVKVVNVIEKRYLRKYLDNRFWKLANDDGNEAVSVVHKQQLLPETEPFFPRTDVDRIRTEHPAEYAFFMHQYERYLYKVKEGTVDPYNQWVILSLGKVFKYSFQYIEDPWDFIKPRPSLLRYLLRGKTKQLEKGILVKYNWANYYHFFVDTLPQIYLCDDMQIPADVPLIVPHDFDKPAYVKEYLERFPPKRKIIVQGKDQYLHVKELYVAKETFCNDHFPRIGQRVVASGIADAEKGVASPELLFIKRKEGINRTLSNSTEIEDVARSFGFEVIEPADYTWPQQVKLFSSAKRIIGIHGAGLTNMVFCKERDVRLFELFPGKNYAPEHYENMAIKLGFKYTSLSGKGYDANRQFHIDKDEFRSALEVFMRS